MATASLGSDLPRSEFDRQQDPSPLVSTTMNRNAVCISAASRLVASFLSKALLLVLWMGCQVTSQEDLGVRNQRTDLRVMTFNIRYGTANDGPNSWPFRKGHVLDVIREYDPDLLGLQESLPFQSQLIDETFPGHALYGPSRLGPDDDGEACSIYWRTDRFERLASGTFWLSETPDAIGSRGWDAALPRLCSWVRLSDKHTNHRFVFANTHFDHRGNKARLESAKLIAKRFPTESVILTGDFNTPENAAPMEALRAEGYQDSFRILHPGANHVGTFTAFKETPRPDKIDGVLFCGSAVVLSAEIHHARRNQRWPSDHIPVSATIRWK